MGFVLTEMAGGSGLAGQMDWNDRGDALVFVSEASKELGSGRGSWWNITVYNFTTGKMRTIDTAWGPGNIGDKDYEGGQCIRPVFSKTRVIYAAWAYGNNSGVLYSTDVHTGRRTQLNSNPSPDVFFCRPS